MKLKTRENFPYVSSRDTGTLSFAVFTLFENFSPHFPNGKLQKMSRKQKKMDAVPRLILEDVIGLTTKNANGFASDESAGICAYLAGCVVVLYDVGADTRRNLLVSSRGPKPLSCVALARQGRRHVAAGESGQVPGVLVWDFSTGSLLSDLKGHQCGVQSVDFSEDGKTLVSLGFQNDNYICVWDWKVGKLSAKVKASATLCPLLSVSFVSGDNSFITVGRKHLKFWNVKSLKSTITSTGKDFPILDGKPVNLGCHRNRSFVSVAPSRTYSGDNSDDSFSAYALTGTGLLCAIDGTFSIKKFVDMKVEKVYSLSLSEDLIACGCNNGVVQLFQVGTLLYVGSTKYGESTATFGCKDLVCEEKIAGSCNEKNDPMPDAIACNFLWPTRLGVIYADHSFYIWDIDHIQKISKCCVLVSHSACIWDVNNLPSKDLNMAGSVYTDKINCHEVSFATCSTDGTIRQWDLAVLASSEVSEEEEELLVNQRRPSIVDDNSCSSVQLVSCGILEHGNDDIKLDGQAFRSMVVSSDGQYLVAGDFSGNLHVFNLQTSTYTCIKEAHRAEIITLSFSKKCQYLVTGSKDRKIHIYDVARNFELVENLEDHSSAITAVFLAYDDNKLISCGADKCIYFRDVLMSDTGCKVLRRHNQLSSIGGINDVVIDPSEKIVLTVGQDRKINKYSLNSMKLVGTFKEEAELGQPVKVLVDPTGSYIVCSYSNKSLRIYDFMTGEVVAQAMGHAEVITGSVFLPDCRHIISVSSDSCIFVWNLPSSLTSKMLQKVRERTSGENNTNMPRDYVSEREIQHIEEKVSTVDGAEDPAFEFSVSRLPKWAQTKVAGKSSPFQEPDAQTSFVDLSLKCSDSVIVPKVNSSISENLNCVDFGQQTSSDHINSRNLLESGLNSLHSTDLNEEDETEGPTDKALGWNLDTTGEQTLSLTADNVGTNASFSQTCDNSSLPLVLDGGSTGGKNFSAHFHARQFQWLGYKRGVETLNPDLSRDLEAMPNSAAKRVKNCSNQEEETDDALNAVHVPHSEGNEVDEIYQLGKILETLDEATEKTLTLCCTIGVGKQRDAMLLLLEDSLPSISKRMETLKNLLGGSRNSPELESAVERFAGSLSDRVLELLKDKI